MPDTVHALARSDLNREKAHSVCPWVSLLVDLAQAGGAHMGVDLGGHKALVTEQFLDTADVSPPIEKMSREAVA